MFTLSSLVVGGENQGHCDFGIDEKLLYFSIAHLLSDESFHFCSSISDEQEFS